MTQHQIIYLLIGLAMIGVGLWGLCRRYDYDGPGYHDVYGEDLDAED